MANHLGRKQTIKVVQMDHHFLYLPFYYALDNDFWGYIPKKYTIEIEDLPHFKHTDTNAFKALMEEPHKNKDIHFAICDPIVVFKDEYITDEKPAILGSLITNSAFWAIDHHTHSTDGFRDLAAYDKIISYEPGTTSYNIADRLYKVSGKECTREQFIKTVDPHNEILELNRSGKGTIALSPNPFQIESLICNGDGDYKINLSLGSTPEYSNVLVTAILSRQQFVNKHPELVAGFLKAIQQAVLIIRHYEEDEENNNSVIAFAEKYFSDGKNAKGALKIALDANVFPSSLEVTKPQWQNAVRANYYESSEKEADVKANYTFSLYIEPYLHMAKQAASELISEKISPSLKSTMRSMSFYFDNFTYIILLILTIYGAIRLGISQVWPIPIITLTSFLITKGFKLEETKNFRALHLGVMAMIGGYTFFVFNQALFTKEVVSSGSIWTTYLALTAVEIAIIIGSSSKQSKDLNG